MEDFVYRARPWAITLARHNWPLVVYGTAFLWAAVRVYRRPSRRGLLYLFGFLSLIVAFEYQKHGVRVANQTTSYLFSTYANPSLRRLSKLILVDAMPVALYLIGCSMLILAMVPVLGLLIARRRNPPSVPEACTK